MSYGSFRKRVYFSNLERRPARMHVYGVGSGRNRRRAAGVYAPQPPAIPTAPLQLTTVRVVCENTLNVALREKGLGRQFRRSHKFGPATLERDAKEFWGVTLQAMDVVADRYRSLAKARISGGETTDLIKELFPTPKVPAGAKPSAAVPEGCREWHRAYSSLNPQKGKSSMYSSTLPGLFSLLATSHSVLLRSCVLRASSRFQLG